jgi:uncharacterized phage protein (TIGR02218 family)
MITLTSQQQIDLNQDVLYLCLLYEIHRTDGVVIYLSDHDEDLTWNGNTYSPVTGVKATSIQRSSGTQARTHDMLGVISSELITEADLASDKYNNAQIREILINWMDLSAGALRTDVYWVDEVTFSQEEWTATVVGVTEWIQQQVGGYYTRECQARLGLPNCNANLTGMSNSGSVVGVPGSNDEFIASFVPADGYHTDGVLTWLTGANAGSQVEVKDQVGDTFTLWLSTNQPIQIGDTFTCQPGCDHLSDDCITKFNNMVNYQGQPSIPGTDAMIAIPNAS